MADKGNDLDRDLSQTEEWFRNGLFKLLGWGIGLLVVFTGWLISSDEVIKPWDDKSKGLVVVAPIVYVLWIVTVRWCYSKCPRHRTVPPAAAIWTFVVIYGLCAAFLVELALDLLTETVG